MGLFNQALNITYVLQNRIERFFLGVHRFAPLAATWIEMDWLNIGQIRKLEMMRLLNRIASMPESRLPKKIFRWEIINGCCAWVGEILSICQELSILSPIGPFMSVYVYDIDALERRALTVARGEWRETAPTMSKLCTYVQVRDMAETTILVNLNLPRYQRAVVARLLCGILPLEVEVGRFSNTKKDLRFCRRCNTQVLEDETHFVIDCTKFEKTRKEIIEPLWKENPNYQTMTSLEKLKWLLCKEMLAKSAPCIETLFKERQSTVYTKS